VVKCAFFLARHGVFAFSANTVTGKSTWSQPALAACDGEIYRIILKKKNFYLQYFSIKS
jgi:hypothetical protein